MMRWWKEIVAREILLVPFIFFTVVGMIGTSDKDGKAVGFRAASPSWWRSTSYLLSYPMLERHGQRLFGARERWDLRSAAGFLGSSNVHGVCLNVVGSQQVRMWCSSADCTARKSHTFSDSRRPSTHQPRVRIGASSFPVQDDVMTTG